MLRETPAVIAVSRAMESKLISRGAPAQKVHRNPSGIHCHEFTGAQPATARVVFVEVGRFVEKKAPDLTLKAFAIVHRALPEAQLRMIGDGAHWPMTWESRRE
jgi:glycosyltransferase involved in cell wall biosynthesis